MYIIYFFFFWLRNQKNKKFYKILKELKIGYDGNCFFFFLRFYRCERPSKKLHGSRLPREVKNKRALTRSTLPSSRFHTKATALHQSGEKVWLPWLFPIPTGEGVSSLPDKVPRNIGFSWHLVIGTAASMCPGSHRD